MRNLAFAGLIVALLVTVFGLACTQPGTPTHMEGAPASAEVLGVAMHSVRVYVVKDVKRDMTCWVAVTNTGGGVAIDCEGEEKPAVLTSPVAPALKKEPVPAADPKLPTLPPMPEVK